MTTKQMTTLVDRYLDARNLKSPNIRKNAIRKVMGFIDVTGTFLSGKDLKIPSDKSVVAAAYERFKGYSLNSAEKSVINHMYELIDGGLIESTPTLSNLPKPVEQEAPVKEVEGLKEVGESLIEGKFYSASILSAELIPHQPGLYCIRLNEGWELPAKSGKDREDGIIYIGQASRSLQERLWEEELNHHRPATFFRSIGAILGYLPPKGSLIGRDTNNYKFSEQDTESIREWIRKSLSVNCIVMAPKDLDSVEEALISKYRPLINIKHNPTASEALRAARKTCVEYAHSR